MTGIDPRERFSATAESYDRWRPSYPAALVDWLVATAKLSPAATVADVGCGTGISTRLLAARGLDVVGIDPNPDMLERARRAGGARYQTGEAVATGLPDRSVDLVTVAQAFHWFDVPAALAEFRRVLRPGGRCAAFWNLRGTSPFLDAYERLLRAESAEHGVLQKPAETIAALRARPELVEVQDAEFAHVQLLDREGLFGRAYSSSYVVHGVARPREFHRALDGLFAEHQRDGSVAFDYRSVTLSWRIA